MSFLTRARGRNFNVCSTATQERPIVFLSHYFFSICRTMCQACSLEWPMKMDKVLISMKTLRNITLEWIFCLLQPLSSQIHLRSKISTFRQSKSRKKLDHLVCTNFICLFDFLQINMSFEFSCSFFSRFQWGWKRLCNRNRWKCHGWGRFEWF